MQRRKQDRAATVARVGARWSGEDAQEILDEWAASGETLHGFALKRGLVPQRLWWWRKRLGGRRVAADDAVGVKTPTFLPVTVRAAEPERVLAAVAIADGLRVELRVLDGASAAWVAQLVRALGAAS